MITYRASDIIKRALQIADLENSSFISYDEMIALLNESYVMMYQKAVDADSQSFVKLFKTTNRIIPMPVDFYQLKSVNLLKDKYLQPILRRPADQNFNELSYELNGNVLEIFGNFSGEIRIEYVPQPKTLTFPPSAVPSGGVSNGMVPNASTLEDTVLDFPNSFYFPYLAYLLALSFMTKQGKDPSLVMPLAEAAEGAFYASMTPDNWTSVRINNVYNV